MHPLALHLSFCSWASRAGDTDSLGWSHDPRTCQFLPPPLNCLFVQARNLREEPISPSTNPVGLHRDPTFDAVVHPGGEISDSSADAGLDRDAMFAVGNVYTGRHTFLI